MENPLVAIAKNEDIKEAVKNAMNKIELPDLNGKSILLKPNCGRRTKPRISVNTNPDVVEAVYNFLKARYQADFLIGDSPIVATNSSEAFESSGFSDLLDDPGLKWIDLDAKDPVTLSVPNGDVIDNVRVSGYFNDVDYIVSIPVLKMHMHTGASLSFKNMKGLIYKRDKVKLHHLQAPEIVEKYVQDIPAVKELDIAIADLSRVFTPHLAVIDASYTMEGLGPSSGNPVKMDTIIVSSDFLAADVAALSMVQPDWSISDVPHLKIISDRRKEHKIHSTANIQFTPEDIDPFTRRIEAPPDSISIKYNNVRLIDVDSCSACLSTVFTFLKDNRDFIDENFTQSEPLNLAIGKGISQDDLYGTTFLIGNCTSGCKDYGAFIKGCTPVQSVIKKEIEKFLSSRDARE